MTQTIEQLQARVRELEADLVAARQIIDEENKDHIEQLAASQLREMQLREACAIAEKTIDIVWASHHANRCDHALELCRKALSQPTSTEALDAYVAEKVKDVLCENELLEHRVLARDAELWGRTQKILELTRQRDLAVNFLTEICKWQKLRDWQLMHMEINEAAEFVEAISTIKGEVKE